MNSIDLNKLRDQAYKTACEHGFHDKKYSNEHWLCLVISELMEAVEADRYGRFTNRKSFEAQIEMPHRPYDTEENIWKSYFERYIKDTVEDELADVAIRLLDFAGTRGILLDMTENTIDMIEEYRESYAYYETFTEAVYQIATMYEKHQLKYHQTIDRIINSMLYAVFGLAKYLNIDLPWYIEQKMKYNELRPKLNGKKY